MFGETTTIIFKIFRINMARTQTSVFIIQQGSQTAVASSHVISQWENIIFEHIFFLLPGASRFYDNIEMMLGFRIGPYMKISWMVTTPIFALVSLFWNTNLLFLFLLFILLLLQFIYSGKIYHKSNNI